MQAVRHRTRKLDDSADPEPDIRSALKSAATYGAYLIAHSDFLREIMGSAADTAESARKQTGRAIKRDVTTDLGKQEKNFADWVNGETDKKMSASLERAEEVYDIWGELTEESEDYDDALERRLDEGLDGIVGGALAYASLAFGGMFGDMIKEAQTDSGVSTYTWLSQMDSHVRPAHAALDGEEASWDDPPLKADVSDNEEDDHPGEDYNCRCVASPNDPDEEGEPN